MRDLGDIADRSQEYVLMAASANLVKTYKSSEDVSIK